MTKKNQGPFINKHKKTSVKKLDSLTPHDPTYTIIIKKASGQNSVRLLMAWECKQANSTIFMYVHYLP